MNGVCRTATLFAFAACLASLPATATTELTIGAAASLKEALSEAGAAFAAANQDLRIRYNFAASPTIVQQLKRGASIDVFVAADSGSMDKVGPLLAPGTRHDLLAGDLVLVVPSSHDRTKITTLADLRRPAVKTIAVCDEAVPAGHYARQWLGKRGLLDAIAPRIVKPESVRAALAMIAGGVADAGFVYATDAAIEADRVRVVARATADDGIDVRYPAAVMARSRHLPEAKRYLAFLRGETARAVFAKFGFRPL